MNQNDQYKRLVTIFHRDATRCGFVEYECPSTAYRRYCFKETGRVSTLLLATKPLPNQYDEPILFINADNYCELLEQSDEYQSWIVLWFASTDELIAVHVDDFYPKYLFMPKEWQEKRRQMSNYLFMKKQTKVNIKDGARTNSPYVSISLEEAREIGIVGSENILNALARQVKPARIRRPMQKVLDWD